MSRIPYADVAHSDDPEVRAIMVRAAKQGTPRPESQAVRARVPQILKTFTAFWDATFYEGQVDHAIKELCRVYVSKAGACEYCGTQRSQKTEQDLSTSDYDELLDFRNSGRYSAAQKAALAWTDAIIWDPGSADDALWRELHRHFSDDELVELGSFIALTLGQQRLLKTLEVSHGDVQIDEPESAGIASP